MIITCFYFCLYNNKFRVFQYREHEWDANKVAFFWTTFQTRCDMTKHSAFDLPVNLVSHLQKFTF